MPIRFTRTLSMRSATSSLPSKKDEKEVENAHDVEVQLARVEEEDEVVDEVFGEQGGAETVNYRTVGWISTAVIMIKSQIGIGVLSLPYAFHTLGLVPGILVLLSLFFMTLWCDYYTGVFKEKHPSVYSLSDAGRLMFGKFGEEFVGVMYWISCVTGTSSALITLSTALNAISVHGTCTAVFVVVSAVAIYPVASFRRLETIKWVGWIGLVFILSALLVLMISVASGDRPSLAPKEGPLDLDVKAFGSPTFAEAMSAVSTMFFAFTANVGFLPYASEMKAPRLFRRVVLVAQPIVLGVFMVIGLVVYLNAGQYVASPALGTAGPLIKRIAYGLALPGIFFTGIIYIHLPAKWMLVRILRGSKHLNHGTLVHWSVWLSCTFGCLVIAYLISQAIPVFNGLVGLVAALVSAPLSLHMEALMYLFDHRAFFKSKADRTPLAWVGVIGNCILLLAATFLLVSGTYGSILDIISSYKNGVGAPFTCADNSNSV
ncbi:hypothetical protein JCM8547_004056 [Rhodosporidiobolus lusitaniae]